MLKSDIVGVTVGVNTPYAPLASIAAQCFTKHTGVSTVVLGEKELIASGLGHPAALRLKAFEYVDAEQIVYFDSDWLCINDWSSAAFSGACELLACRDFILTDEWPQQRYRFESDDFLKAPTSFSTDASSASLRHDYIHEVRHFAGLHLPCAEWINTGLLVMNRRNHKAWLGTALKLYQGEIGHHAVYYEQPAIVKAIESLQLPVRLLPRKCNVLAAYPGQWPDSVIGLHIKVKRHSAFVDDVVNGVITTAEDVSRYFMA